MGSGGSRFGAGRPGYKVKAESLARLDIRHLASSGILGGGVHTVSWSSGASIGVTSIPGESLRLSYSYDGAPTSQRVPLLNSSCRLGGSRTWLGCPCCSRRVGVLYLRQGRFACRTCQRVAYASQSEDACGRSWRMQQKLERRLAADWRKPKWMRWATHDRLIERLSACEETREQALAGFVARLMSGRV